MKNCARCGAEFGFWARVVASRSICADCETLLTENLPKYKSKLDEIMESIPISESSIRDLTKLQQDLELTDADVKPYSGELVHAQRLGTLMEGEIPILEHAEIILRKNEICHYSYPVQLIEIRKRTQYVGGSKGVSVRIAKGLSYRVGGFNGERVTTEHNEITDCGDLTVTNKRVVFQGSKKNVTYTIGSITAINKFGNAV